MKFTGNDITYLADLVENIGYLSDLDENIGYLSEQYEVVIKSLSNYIEGSEQQFQLCDAEFVIPMDEDFKKEVRSIIDYAIKHEQSKINEANINLSAAGHILAKINCNRDQYFGSKNGTNSKIRN